MRDPCSFTRAHDGLERGDESTRRLVDDDPVPLALMDVRLAIADDDDLLPAQVVPENLAYAVRRPGDLFFFSPSMLRFDITNEFAKIARDGMQVAFLRFACKLSERLTAQQRAKTV